MIAQCAHCKKMFETGSHYRCHCSDKCRQLDVLRVDEHKKTVATYYLVAHMLIGRRMTFDAMAKCLNRSYGCVRKVARDIKSDYDNWHRYVHKMELRDRQIFLHKLKMDKKLKED